jgi:thiol-disulfide isomerase/thioredoxin
MTNAKKAKQQRASGTRKPNARPKSGGRPTMWIGIAAVAVVLVVVAVILGNGGGASGGGYTPAPDGSVTVARDSLQPLQIGDKIPDWSAPALEGYGDGTLAWSQYHGTPTVLSVWASWCPHCQVELPRLAAAVDSRPGIQLVSVTTALGREAGPTPGGYMASNNLTFPVALDDANTTLMKGLGVTGFPTTYFVDASGTIVQKGEGEIDAATLDRYLQQLSAG